MCVEEIENPSGFSDDQDDSEGQIVDAEVKVAPRTYTRDQHNISRRNIDPDALKIMYRLINAGFRAYMVGGGVRDILLGIKPKDFDISTDARPNQIRTLFRNSRAIGRRFRLIHIYFRGNKIIEVSTFRTAGEIAEPGEENGPIVRSENVYGTEQTDAFRRDLSINGLFYDLSTFSIIDYVGGVEDLRSGTIRIIGDPDLRFREDPVRLIRTVRHAARTDFTIEPITLKSLHRNARLITGSATMRLFEEVRKDFKSGRCLAILRALAREKLLDYLLPELTNNDAELLRQGHGCAEAIGRADDIIRAGDEISTTAILSAIALFTGGGYRAMIELATRFHNEDDLLDHLPDCFSILAVPKKEREKIEQVTVSWFNLLRADPQRLKATSFTRKPYFHDLIDFMELVQCSDQEEAILKMMKRWARDPALADHEDRRPRAPRQRRPTMKRKLQHRGG